MLHYRMAVVPLSIIAFQAASAAVPAYKLKLVYSNERIVCHEIAHLLAHEKICRRFDESRCTPTEANSIKLNGKSVTLFDGLATNEYGYTQVAKSTSTSGEKYAVVYLNQFQGDLFPRLLQTWKVDAEALDAVLKLPPGPLPYEKWIALKTKPPKNTNSSEFSALLKHGEKLSNEWSPVINASGGHYVMVRECSGRWRYGGYYACNRVIRLTVKRLVPDRPSVSVCQFARPKK